VEKRAGWWIEIGVAPLVEALKQALALSPDELSEMGQRGRRWMQDEFSWDSLGLKMARTYEWIVRGGARPEWVIDG
ncbi:MAG: hypothetical protein NNA21_13015, partial [Nitrospira sp.]|nr:hypothetical protein [Nitrospira sp.]